MTRRVGLGLLALALLLVAAFLPSAWYDTIPRTEGMVLPFSGAVLLRLTFLVEGLAVGILALRPGTWSSITSVHGPLVSIRSDWRSDVSHRQAMVALGVITAMGLALRVYGLDQDLWIDEVSPLLDYMLLTPAQILGSYLRSNNHLLNTLLERIVIGLFGESESMVRIPAVAFGVLTIPCTYWVARLAMSRVAALGAALVLAASYHHVFFSQNARGYSAYLFFALLATGLLIEALRDDRLWRWVLYVGAVVLGSASLLITAFVIAAHAIVCTVIWVGLARNGGEPAHFARRIGAVMAVTGFLAFQVYAAALPEAFVVITTVYTEASTGFAPFSAAFFRETLNGLSAGFGSPLAVAGFLALGAMGFASLATAAWPVALALWLPAALTAILLAARGLTFSPRFFLILLPLAILAAMSAVEWIILRIQGAVAMRRVWAIGGIAAAGLILAFGAGHSLPYYYRTPKQPYRAAVSIVEARGSNAKIVVVSNAEMGFRYYSRRLGAKDSSRYAYVRTKAQFDSVVRHDVAGLTQVVTTFPRALEIELPEIAGSLEREWQRDTTLSATVGDGEIVVWSRKNPLGITQK